MKKSLNCNAISAALLLASAGFQAHAWGHMAGTVDVLHVNTYGNYLDGHLNGGFCFRLKGQDKFLKIAHSESGEQRRNLELVQKLVLTAHLTGKELRATFVDWGEDTSCRMNGNAMPARWLEDLQLMN